MLCHSGLYANDVTYRSPGKHERATRVPAPPWVLEAKAIATSVTYSNPLTIAELQSKGPEASHSMFALSTAFRVGKRWSAQNDAFLLGCIERSTSCLSLAPAPNIRRCLTDEISPAVIADRFSQRQAPSFRSSSFAWASAHNGLAAEAAKQFDESRLTIVAAMEGFKNRSKFVFTFILL